MIAPPDDELVGYLCASHALTAEHAAKLVDDVLAYFDETTEEFVRRRHRELKAQRQLNAEIFDRIGSELVDRRVVSDRGLSARQIRRLIYG